MNMAVQTPATDDERVEQMIQRKGKTAPRVTLAGIDALIAEEHYINAGEAAARHDHPALGSLTFCVLVLKNGFTVTGESACASLENFDAQIGCKIARQNAVNKIWLLEGYLLKQRLHESA